MLRMSGYKVWVLLDQRFGFEVAIGKNKLNGVWYVRVEIPFLSVEFWLSRYREGIHFSNQWK